MTYQISFTCLKVNHLSRLLKWLNKPHVKEWWDQDVNWTSELVKEKFGSYVEGYKLDHESKKAIEAFVICVDGREVGYCQSYDVADFPVDGFVSHSKQVAGLDLFIGEGEMIGRGWGAEIIQLFCENHIDQRFEACFVDPNKDNTRAIRAFEKAGFRKIMTAVNNAATWMLREKQ
jgi:aminoglycoside 6'-N-acetyltransferase